MRISLLLLLRYQKLSSSALLPISITFSVSISLAICASLERYVVVLVHLHGMFITPIIGRQTLTNRRSRQTVVTYLPAKRSIFSVHFYCLRNQQHAVRCWETHLGSNNTWTTLINSLFNFHVKNIVSSGCENVLRTYTLCVFIYFRWHITVHGFSPYSLVIHRLPLLPSSWIFVAGYSSQSGILESLFVQR